MTNDDSNFDLSSGRDTLEEYGVQVYHGKALTNLSLHGGHAVYLPWYQYMLLAQSEVFCRSSGPFTAHSP